MSKLNEIIKQTGISKVKLAEYLGVSRQMIYNYLNIDNLDSWPEDKKTLMMNLLNISDISDVDQIKVDADYILDFEKRLSSALGEDNNNNIGANLSTNKMTKTNKEVFNDLVMLLSENLASDSKQNTELYRYLLNFLQTMETANEIKYMMAYVAKSTGLIDPKEFVFNEEEQFIFEGIMYSAMTLFTNGGTSRSKIALTHKRFVEEITHKKEEKLSRTQELNTAKHLALKELGYTELTSANASAVFAKIAEIQSRKI